MRYAPWTCITRDVVRSKSCDRFISGKNEFFSVRRGPGPILQLVTRRANVCKPGVRLFLPFQRLETKIPDISSTTDEQRAALSLDSSSPSHSVIVDLTDSKG